MKKHYSIAVALLLTACALPAASRFRGLTDTEVHTSSGVALIYRGGTLPREAGTLYLRRLDRELSRLFRPPPGTGGCRIIIDREFTGRISARSRKKVREILLQENFAELVRDPEFQGRLAGEILGGRFGIQGELRPLPAWIVWGLEGIRQNTQDADRIVRNQLYFPVLRGLLGIGCMPDFRAVMQLSDGRFTGSARGAMCEFGRFLLEIFSRISSVRQNALGDYAAGVLQGTDGEPAIYRATLLPVMTSARYGKLGEDGFFKAFAETFAFNYRTPRSAEDLLVRLPGVLKFEVDSVEKSGKKIKGDLLDLPDLFAQKKPEAITGRQQIWQKLVQFSREMPPEVAPAAGKLMSTLGKINAIGAETGREELQQGRVMLENHLKNWVKIEKYLDRCEQEKVPPGLIFRKELSTVSEDADFLTTVEKAFFDQVEKKYLEH